MKGKILGSRYRVIEYIAEGGFGRTYLAEDTLLPGNDLCVVKQLSPSFSMPELLAVARRLFKTEAKALHSLGHHPQIPELLAYFEEAEKFYLVQQYIQGRTLDAELTRGKVWTTNKVIELLRDCLNILKFIHERGVIHRDIKPANLIRRHADNKIVVVDFGTVKEVLQGQTTLPQLTVAVGTQGYMPIEQARGKPRSTSDIYALGIIGIQALTGTEPLNLEEDKNNELIWSHLANTNHRLIGILTKMTRYYYGDRYQSARSILAALDSCTDAVVNLRSTAIAELAEGIASSPDISSQVIRQNRSFRNEQIAATKPLATSQTIKQFESTEHRSGDRTKQQDPNALPGVRSVPIIEYARSKAKSKLTGKKLWKIVLISIVACGGVYISLQKLIIQPNLNRSQPEATLNSLS